MQLPALSLSSLGLSIRQSKTVQGVQDQAWSPLGVGPRAGACLRARSRVGVHGIEHIYAFVFTQRFSLKKGELGRERDVHLCW